MRRRRAITERQAKGVFVMVPHPSRSNRPVPVLGLVLVLAATLPSCGRGADTPPAGNGAAAGTAAPAPAPPPPPPRELTWSKKVDMTLWSAIRVKTYKAALQRETPPTLAILRIPRIKLEVPVYDGTTDAVLDLAAGRIEYTALPGTTGNVGIAAHRDGFFRVLKDIKEGDALVLDTPVALEQYRVEWIKITTPDDVSVIDPTPGRAVTLVGCYPFYHQGPAPQRFIVRAVPAAGSPAGS
jgi:sortase A